MKKLHLILTLCAILMTAGKGWSQIQSLYFQKGESWQESVTNSIRYYHQEKDRISALLKDESAIKLEKWYSLGGFKGDGTLLHKMEFGPETNSDLEREYAGGLKWIARAKWEDGEMHNFDGVAQEVTYLQRTISLSEDREILAYISSDDGLHVWLNGSLIFENDADRGLERSQETIPLHLLKGDNTIMLKINNRGGLQGFYFSLLPDHIVYEREMEKVWAMAFQVFPDPESVFQMERENTDGIWDSQIKAFDESALKNNYLEKIKGIPVIADYGDKYLASAGNKADLDVIRGLYYITCKFDNIIYLDDSRESDDATWNNYKSDFEAKAVKAASVLINENGNTEQLSMAKTDLDQAFSSVPLKLPSGPDSMGRFGAYYTTLKYDLDWDKHWRIGDFADVVVNFDQADYKFVFWRGTSYIPCWVTGTGVWYTNEFVERRGFHSPNTEGCVEPMSDKQCRYSHVRIIENNDARVVVHWRYAPVDVMYEHPFTDPATGWSDWVDEVYTIYPSGVGVRKITIQTNRPDLWTEFQEAIVINQPGTLPEDNIEPGAVSLANMKGEGKTYYWTEQGGPEFEEGPEYASIMKINLKADHSPFALVSPPVEKGNLITSYLGHAPSSIFNFWDHWPVSQDASDGRIATSAERPSHSSLGHIGLPGMADMEWLPYEAEGIKRTKIMLHGMTDQAVEDLVPLAKAWLYAPPMEVDNQAYSNEGYDPAQAAYVLCLKDKDQALPLDIQIQASQDAPLINPAIVIKNWGSRDIELILNGKTVERGADFRYGLTIQAAGNDLVVWIKAASKTPVSLSLKPL